MYYQPSNRVDTVRTIVGVVLAIAILLGISYLYNAINAVIPVVYASVVTCIGYGLLIGVLSKAVVHFGKIRGKKIALGVTLLLGIVASYTQWVAFVTYIFNEDGRNFFMYLNAAPYFLAHPGDLLDSILYINETGSWSMSTADLNVSGPLLSGIWLGEFALLTAYPIWTVYKKSFPPYSETQDKYYPSYVLTDNFSSIYTPGNAVTELRNRPQEYLQNNLLSGPYPISRIYLYYLPTDRNSYISLQRISLDQNRKEVVSPIIEYLRISSHDARTILNEFPHQSADIASIF